MAADHDDFVILFRSGPRAKWAVQPYVYTEEAGMKVGTKLIERFGGEAWLAPVDVPGRVPVEVPKELENGS